MTKKERLRKNHTKNGRKKRKVESPNDRQERKLRLFHGTVKEIKKREFREAHGRELALKLLDEGVPVFAIPKLHKKCMYQLEGTNYVH